MCVVRLSVAECVCVHICVCLQIILQTLLSKAEEKLSNGERILKEHENIDSTMAVSQTADTDRMQL